MADDGAAEPSPLGLTQDPDTKEWVRPREEDPGSGLPTETSLHTHAIEDAAKRKSQVASDLAAAAARQAGDLLADAAAKVERVAEAAGGDRASVAAALLAQASEGAAAAAGVLLAAATAAEDEARLLSEGIRRSTPLEARETSIALRTDDDAVTKMMPQTEEEALVVDALSAKRMTCTELQGKVRGLVLEIRRLNREKAAQDKDTSVTVAHWERKVDEKEEALQQLQRKMDEATAENETRMAAVSEDCDARLSALEEQVAATETRLKAEVAEQEEELAKVQSFRSNKNKLEKELKSVRKQLEETRTAHANSVSKTEREGYEEKIRVKKMVGQATAEGVETSRIQQALLSYRRLVDGERVGLTVQEALVKLLVELERGDYAGRRGVARPVQQQESQEDTRARLPQLEPSVPLGTAGSPRAPPVVRRRRGRGAATEREKAVEFPLVPMPASGPSLSLSLSLSLCLSAGFGEILRCCVCWPAARTTKESYGRWRYGWEGQWQPGQEGLAART